MMLMATLIHQDYHWFSGNGMAGGAHTRLLLCCFLRPDSRSFQCGSQPEAGQAEPHRYGILQRQDVVTPPSRCFREEEV